MLSVKRAALNLPKVILLFTLNDLFTVSITTTPFANEIAKIKDSEL